MSLRCRDVQWCPGWFLTDHAPAYAVPSLMDCPARQPMAIHRTQWGNGTINELSMGDLPLPYLMKPWSFDYDKIWESWNYHCSTWLLQVKSNETIDNLMKKPYLDEKPYDLFILILLITQCYTFLESKCILSWWSMARLHFRLRKTAVRCPIPIPSTSHCIPFTLWLFNIAMENCPFIDGLPGFTYQKWWFSMAMLNTQMVILFNHHSWDFLHPFHRKKQQIPAFLCSNETLTKPH